MTEETKLVFAQLNNALKRLEEVANMPISSHKVEIEATIHCFEFTIELFWKALKKKLLDDYGVDVQGPKPVLQQAYAMKLINNEKKWLDMMTDRNLTSHTYKEALANQIYHNIKTYVPFLREEFQHCLTR